MTMIFLLRLLLPYPPAQELQGGPAAAPPGAAEGGAGGAQAVDKGGGRGGLWGEGLVGVRAALVPAEGARDVRDGGARVHDHPEGLGGRPQRQLHGVVPV